MLSMSVLSVDVYRLLHQPMTIENHQTTIIRVDKSMSASSLVHRLSLEHRIHSERLLLLLIQLQGLSKQLKAGIYQARVGETALEFLYRVAQGDVMSESFRIIEGTTMRHISSNLKHTMLLTYNADDWSTIANDLPGLSLTIKKKEGLLLADTYRYEAGSRGQDLLRRAHEHLKDYLLFSWQHCSHDLPYKTPYELLIAASILEKETAMPDEKRLIAGVIVNRLRKNMPLQMDPTVIYALGLHYKGTLSKEDLQIDSPYNSYRYRGLPPTPIAMVGRDAIDAAAHPTSTDYLYFVARGDGRHHFSVTYEQQRLAIARYLRNNSHAQ